MSKRYKFFLILNIVLISISSIIFLGKAIYVIANGPVKFGITDDVAPYNPIIPLLLAFVCALAACALIAHYKTEKEYYEKLSLLKERLSHSGNSDMNNRNNKHNADGKNDTKTNSEHYHNL